MGCSSCSVPQGSAAIHEAPPITDSNPSKTKEVENHFSNSPMPSGFSFSKSKATPVGEDYHRVNVYGMDNKLLVPINKMIHSIFVKSNGADLTIVRHDTFDAHGTLMNRPIGVRLNNPIGERIRRGR
jgi:hypothetical protein